MSVRALLGAGCALLGLGCFPFGGDCPRRDTLRGVRNGEILETVLERVEPPGGAGTPSEQVSCGTAIRDVGASFRWKARWDGPGDACLNRIQVDALVRGMSIVPTGATLPSGCTGSWDFRVIPRDADSILAPLPPGAAPTWVMWRWFLPSSPAGSCGLMGGTLSCGDAFVAPTTPVH